MHAGAADRLDDREGALAVAEHVEDRRKGSHVPGEGAVPDEVADDAEQLAQHDPDHLHPIRHFDAGQLLDGQHVGEVVHHAAQVVDAVGVGDVGVPGLALAHLLGAAVVVADVGHGVDDLLAVQLEDDAQDAVRAGVLRPEVEEHEVGVFALPLHPPVLGAELQRLFLRFLLVVGQAEGRHLGGARGMVLAQRVALPGRRHQYPLEVGMAVEGDAEHVPDLALVPVGGGPDIDDAGQRRLVAGERHLDADVVVTFVGKKVVDDREVARRLTFTVGAHTLVDGGQVVEHAVGPLRLRLEDSAGRGTRCQTAPRR